MTELLVTSLVIFTGYLALIWYLFGWIPSISDSHYEFDRRYGKKYEWVFVITVWAFTIPLMIAGIDMSQHSNFQFLMFFATAGLCFTGAAPYFMRKLDRKVHYIGAVMGIGLGTISLGIIFSLWWMMILIIIGIGIMYLMRIKNKIYWMEVYAFYLIIFSLLYIQLFGK